MEEKTKPVFVVATANDIARLPPELLRKGRFDEIFFVDLPTSRERAEILMIQLARRRDPTEFDLRAIVEATDGFSGAELEELVISGLYAAFSSEERTLTTEHVLRAAREIVPLSRSRQADIVQLRAWADTNARPAAQPPEQANQVPPDDVTRRRERLIDF
jgi:SpoVK/Ycf46/Vps4 family AAA+-type ATPase